MVCVRCVRVCECGGDARRRGRVRRRDDGWVGVGVLMCV